MNSKKNLKRNLLICLLAGSAVMYTLPLHAATSVIGNGTLPSGGEVMAGQIDIPDWARPGGTNPAGNLEMNIIQNSHNGVINGIVLILVVVQPLILEDRRILIL